MFQVVKHNSFKQNRKENRFEWPTGRKVYVLLHSICEEEVGLAARCKVICCMFLNIAYIVYKVNACVAFK